VPANEVTLRIQIRGNEVSEEAIEDLIKEIRRLRRAADRAADNLDDMGNESRNVNESFRALKQGASILAGAGLYAVAAAAREAAQGLKEGTQTAADFQFAISKAAARTDASAKTLEKFGRVAKTASADSAFGAMDAADGLTEMAKAGFDAQQSASALKGVLSQAAAAQVDVGTASKVSTGILKSFGKEVNELSSINDTLVRAATTTKTNVKDLGLSLGVVGSAANQAGLSLEQTTSILAKMQDKNLSASRAAIALRRAIAVLSDPTSQSRKELQQMGIALDESAPVAEQLFTVFEKLQGSGNKVGAMAQVLGVRAGPTLQAALSQGVKGIKEYTRELEDASGATDKIANFQLDNLAGVMKKLQGSATNLVIEAFEPMASELKVVAQSVLSLVNQLQSSNKSMGSMQSIVGAMVETFAFFARNIQFVIGAVHAVTVAIEGWERALHHVGLASEESVKQSRANTRAVGQLFHSTTNLINNLDESADAMQLQGIKLMETADGYTRLKNTVKQATQAIKKNITVQQAQTRTKQTLQTIDALGERWSDFRRKVREGFKEEGKNPEMFDMQLTDGGASRVKEISGRMRQLVKELDRVKQFNAGELNHLEGDQADKAHRLKKEIRSLNQEAFETSRVFDAVASGEKNMRIGQLRTKFRNFMRATAQSNAKMEKFAALMNKAKEEGEDMPKKPLGGNGDGGGSDKEGDQGPSIQLLKLKLALARATKKERKENLEQRIEIFKVGQKNLDSERESLILARKLEKLETEREKRKTEQAKKIASLNSEAHRQLKLNKTNLRITQNRINAGAEMSAQQKRENARLEHQLQLKETRQEFDQKRLELEQKMRELGEDGLSDTQRQNLQEQERLALMKQQKDFVQQLRDIESERETIGARVTSQLAGATENMFAQMNISSQLSDVEDSRLSGFETATQNVNSEMDGLKEKIRGIKLGGTTSSEEKRLSTLKAQLDVRKRILDNIKDAKTAEKQSLEQKRKEIERMTEVGKSFQMVAKKTQKVEKGLAKISAQGGKAFNALQTIGRLVKGPLGDADSRVKDVGKAFDGMTSTIGSVGQAAQGMAKAFGASLKTRAAIQAGFQGALGVARAAQAAMGNPAAAAAAASHFASAGMFAAISDKAPKKGGKSAQSIRSGAGSDVPSSEDLAKDFAEELKDQEAQGEVIYNDYAGATLLEDSPGVQREINNATASAKARTVKRRAKGRRGG